MAGWPHAQGLSIGKSTVRVQTIQGYLANKKTPTPLGPP